MSQFLENLIFGGLIAIIGAFYFLLQILNDDD